MKHKLVTIVLSVAVIASLLLVGCAPKVAPPAAPEAEYNWRFGMPYVGQAIRNESEAMFCELVGDYSDGRIEMEYYPDGLLGTHKEIFHAVQEGSIQFGHFSPYVDIVPGGMLNWMPWTVGSFDEADIAYAPDGILFKVMTDAWADVGCKLVFNSSFGPYGIGNNLRPLKTPDDFKNIKFRVSASLGFVRTIENMSEGTGLTCETIPWADLYNALERGVVDGNWTLWPSLIEERHFEVLKYYTALGFGWDNNNIVMNKELWDGLPQELKDAIWKAGRQTEERDYEAHRRSQAGFIKMAADSGLEIYYPTAAEREVFRKKANMPAIWEELCTPWLDEHYPGQNMTKKILDELARISAEVAGA